jgi:hypothetical protein
MFSVRVPLAVVTMWLNISFNSLIVGEIMLIKYYFRSFGNRQKRGPSMKTACDCC